MTDERSGATLPATTDTIDLRARLDDLERQLRQRDQHIYDLTSQLGQVRQEAAEAARGHRLLATLTELLPLGVYVWHLESPDDPRSFRLVVTNPAASAATGVQARELLGKTMAECFPELCETPVPAIYAEVVRSGQPAQLGEMRYGDLRVRPSVFDVQAVPLPNNCVGVLFHNKTEQADTEHSLRRSQALFGGIVDLSEDAIISINAEQQITLFNPAAERIFGYRADAVLGQPLAILLPERSTGVHSQHLARFLQSPDTLRPMSTRSQIFGRRSDGSEFPAEATIGKFDIDGSPILTVRMRDISERMRAQQALRDSEERWRLLISGVTDYAMMLLDPDGRVTSWNTGAERITGYREEEILGQHISLFHLPEAQPQEETRAALQQAVATGAHEEEGWRVRKNGSRFWANTVITALTDEAGLLRGFAKVTRDITERKQAEEERLQLQEEIIRIQKAALAELSTPLIPINDQVVVMPLVGSVDTYRAEQVMVTLLEGISHTRARVAILDITGVPVVDTQVANALLRIAQSAKLLGTHVVLTGIRPEVAQTLVGLGVGLDGIVTRGTLQSGIAYAMGRA